MRHHKWIKSFKIFSWYKFPPDSSSVYKVTFVDKDVDLGNRCKQILPVIPQIHKTTSDSNQAYVLSDFRANTRQPPLNVTQSFDSSRFLEKSDLGSNKSHVFNFCFNVGLSGGRLRSWCMHGDSYGFLWIFNLLCQANIGEKEHRCIIIVELIITEALYWNVGRV